MNKQAKGQSKDTQPPLPLEVERLIPAWQQRIGEIHSALHADPDQAQVNQWRWEVGSEISRVLREHAGATPVTAFLSSLSRRLACSRTRLYDFIKVGEMFSQPLPPQHWETLRYLARIEDPLRRQEALLLLPDWAPVRSLKPTKQETAARKAERELKLTEGQDIELAIFFASKLDSSPRLYIALQILKGFDEKAVADLSDPTLEVNLICEAAERLRTLLHPSVPAGTDDQPTG